MAHNKVKQSTPNSNHKPRLMFIPFTPERAEAWLSWVNALVLGAGILLAILTILQFKLSAINERFSDDRITANEAETARANEGAELAKKRTAELELELEKVIAAQSPRTLSEAGAKVLRDSLAGKPRGAVRVMSHTLDPEAERFARQVHEFLSANGYASELHCTGVFTHSGNAIAVVDTSSEPPHAAALQEAFIAAGYAIPALKMKEEKGKAPMPKDMVLIAIGRK